jgi:hypothetical protein
MKPEAGQRCAVLIDGSALFFAIRDYFEGQSLDYASLLKLLGQEFGNSADDALTGTKARLLVLPPNPGSVWQFWSAAAPQNEGQARFLSYIETTLGIPVRRFSPLDSIMLDPQTALATLGESSRLKERLTRFDASIAFMMGRLATNHQIILMTDSFALAEPFVRAARARWKKFGAPQPPNVLTFFGRAVDSRWHNLFRFGHFGGASLNAIKFLDLDPHVAQLFGVRREAPRSWWADDIAFGHSEGD